MADAAESVAAIADRAGDDVIPRAAEAISKRKQSADASDRDAEEFTTTVAEAYGVVWRRNNKRQRIEILKANPRNDEKPPLPPKPKQLTEKMHKADGGSKLRAKFDQIHATTVQKLTAQNDQLRIENNTLRSALATEQNVVRNLR